MSVVVEIDCEPGLSVAPPLCAPEFDPGVVDTDEDWVVAIWLEVAVEPLSLGEDVVVATALFVS